MVSFIDTSKILNTYTGSGLGGEICDQAFRESPPSLTFFASLSFSPPADPSPFLLMAMLATGLGLPLDPEAPSEDPPAGQNRKC